MPSCISKSGAWAILWTAFLVASAGAALGPQRGTGTWIEPADAADLDFDGFVDDADFVLFSLQYDVLECADHSMPEDCSADLNRDGNVDDQDFVIFSREYNRRFAVVS